MRRTLATSAAAGGAGAMRARPLCYADPKTKTINVGAGAFSPPASFFDEVADAKAVADAGKYVNNVERYVGTVKVPVGLIGPLRVRMDDDPRPDREELIDKTYHVPMATTEGVLLASYNRGAKAITMSGGAWASVTSRQMVRAPAFTFESVRAATVFLKWFRASGVESEVKAAIATQPHCSLMRLEAKITDRTVHVHVGIDSEDAAGQNMVTYCGRVIMNVVAAKYRPADAAMRVSATLIEGGFNGGKRGSSGLHLAQGKGHSVTVDALIPASVLEALLRTTPERIVSMQRLHAKTASFIGTLGSTAHVANGLAAFYIANGQDPACVAESHAAVTSFEVFTDQKTKKQSLYASMTLPSLIVSTIGGGTRLPSQGACLDLIGAKHSNELACVLAATCLAGEVSFYGAIVADEFDAAHWNATHKA